MEMDRNQQRIEATFLTQCSPQAAYDWLFEHRYIDDDVPPWLFDFSKILEYLLVRRDDLLIDLGIARFGHSSKTIRRVFKRGNIGVRCAALSNVHIGPGGIFREGWIEERDIKELIRIGPKAELESLAKNRFLHDDALEQIIERKGAFVDLSDDQYIHMLMWLGCNRRMSAKYDRRILNGLAEYSHERVFSLAWDLARHLPATKAYAYVLYKLLQNTALPVRFDNPESLLERWRIEKEPKDGKRALAYSYYLRSRLSDVLEADEKLFSSNDPAVRESFYRRFSPRKFKDWASFIERDGEFAFDGMVENNELWCSTENRELLRDIAWKIPDPHSSMSAPNTYNAVEERKRKENPEWFVEEDSEYSNAPDAIVRRIEKKLNKVVDAIKAFPDNDNHVNTEVREIAEKVEKLIERIKDSDTDNQNELRQELYQVRDELPETETITQPMFCKYTGAPVWPWIIVIGLLALILLNLKHT